MLKANLNSAELEPLIVALETLQQAPLDQARLAHVEAAFRTEYSPGRGADLCALYECPRRRAIRSVTTSGTTENHV